MADEKFTRVMEGERIIEQLFIKYPKILWAVGDPRSIAVLGIENKERPKSSSALATISRIPSKMKALLEGDNAKLTYVIQLYWSDWHKWSVAQRQIILFHECMHISTKSSGMIDHDVKDFYIILDAVGLGYLNAKDLPDLLATDVEFDENLVPATIMEKSKGDSDDKG